MVAAAKPSPRSDMGFKEFTALIALMMALNAIAIDSMLPALPAIGAALGVATDNERQWIITAYMLGFGSAQLFYGVLGDRFGRRPVLIGAIGLYVAASALAAFAPSLELLLGARVIQGIGAAATRVLCIAVVRDCYSGRTMARVMSLVFIVFLAAPMVAPAMGQAVLAIAHWRWIFGALGLIGAIIFTWASARLPETQHPEDRLPIQARRIFDAFKVTLTTRQSLGYTIAMTVGFSGLVAFITSAQQIFFDTFGAERAFPAIFAAIAVGMGVSNFFNSRIVERLGMRRVSHTALFAYIAVTCAHAAFAYTGLETLLSFSLFQGAAMFCFGLLGPNFGALAMEPMGHVAGVASSVQGTISTIGAALVGFAIGQQFDGTAAPFAAGVAVTALSVLVVILIVEKGRLFGGPIHVDAPRTPRA